MGEESLYSLRRGGFKGLSQALFSAFSKVCQAPNTVGGRGSGLQVVEVMILTFWEGQKFLFYWPSQECMQRESATSGKQ